MQIEFIQFEFGIFKEICLNKYFYIDITISEFSYFRFKKEKDERTEKRQEAERKALAEQAAKADRDAAERSTIARLQFRLPDGRSRTNQFPADSTLGMLFIFNVRMIESLVNLQMYIILIFNNQRETILLKSIFLI